ncbi:kinase-like domain-containing protein [Rhypophila decipiens]|uniref:Autophagy-related protein 1 n=1 Tax=Rhypophila decipiens TaxID=261697 RepID=A0AAN6Y335_9PEZI|nr:kinase-like domain-containing protein [Rhypophila decipiens]
MAPSRLTSDLVRGSKIETEVLETSTKHVFYTPGSSAKERQVRKEEKWVRDAYLGQGAFGTVHRERCEEGERKDTVRAVKEIKKRVMAGEELDYNRELEAIVKFSNPRYSHCFVRSDGWFETPNSVFITMEYLELGDLQSHLAHPLHEFDARDITAQIIEGLHIMHENDFIADFGISKRRLDDVTSLRTLQRGTFGFAAPEIFGLGSGANLGSYTSAVDMWSLGAVVHKILTGNPPFQGLSEVFKYISGQASFPMTDLQKRGVSENGQDFVSKLMAESPKDRLTAAGAAQHPWMTMHLDAPEDL